MILDYRDIAVSAVSEQRIDLERCCFREEILCPHGSHSCSPRKVVIIDFAGMAELGDVWGRIYPQVLVVCIPMRCFDTGKRRRLKTIDVVVGKKTIIF